MPASQLYCASFGTQKEKIDAMDKLYKKAKSLKRRDEFLKLKATAFKLCFCANPNDSPPMDVRPRSQVEPGGSPKKNKSPKLKGSPKHPNSDLQNMTFSWRPGKFPRSARQLEETAVLETCSNENRITITKAPSLESFCDNCLPHLGSLRVLEFANFDSHHHRPGTSTGQWLYKIAQNEASLHAAHALGYWMASGVATDNEMKFRAQEHYISALSVASKIIPENNTIVSFIHTVAFLGAYCAISGDAESCRTHYQALSRMTHDLKYSEMLDQTDRNLILVTSSVALKFLLEPSIVHPTWFGCHSWEVDNTVAEFKSHFVIHCLPVADFLRQEQGLKLIEIIQECRALVDIGKQLLSLPLDQFSACRRVQVWIETRYHVLITYLTNICCEFENREEPFWACVTLGILCSLHLVYHTRHDPRRSCIVLFSHLKQRMERLDLTLQAGKHVDVITWMCFVGACGEQTMRLLLNKDHIWFTSRFKQAVEWPKTRNMDQLVKGFEQFLYDGDVHGPLLSMLYE